MQTGEQMGEETIAPASRRSARGASRRSPLTVALVSLVLLQAATSLAVPPRPDVWRELRATGQLADLIDEEKRLARDGLNQPPERPIRLRIIASAADGAGESAAVTGLHIPILLVDFPDHGASAHGNEDRSWYEELLLSTDVVATGSMRDFYDENSYGAFELTGQVSGWHRMQESYAYYTDGQRGTGGAYPHNARRLAEDAVRRADLLDPTLDWSDFDRTGPTGEPDGIVDGLIVVHAGPGFEATSNPNDIHSHYWTTVDEEVIVDGVRVTSYVVCPQDGRVGVFAHEFGHNLGLTDLYDTDPGAVSTGVGVWAVMGFGSWLDRNGNTLGPESGTRPSHFCAWSKVKLGFAEPITPTGNLSGVRLRPVEIVPDIYQLWTNGSSSRQYFLVENRAPLGFDQGLPYTNELIGGLLVWHIDEDRATNDDTNHLLVALEQADGLRQIEHGTSIGDANDAFSLGGSFHADSQPSSRDYDDHDTQVALGNIVPNYDDASFTADLTVETAPALRRVALTLHDETGNGDGGLDATETAALTLEITNIGLAASNVLVTLTSVDPLVIVEGQANPGDLAADASATLERAFTIHVGELDRDPYSITLDLQLTATDYQYNDTIELVAGDTIGYQSDLETIAATADWRHESGRSGYRDDWHLATARAYSGSYSWHCAPEGQSTYADRTDGLLDTPLIALDGHMLLSFWQWLDLEFESSSRAWDGGVVELSIDGGAWLPIEPAGGYPYTIIRNQESPIADRGAFSGAHDWHQVFFDLTGYSGAGRLRFHFAADGSITAEGWYLDNVLLASSAEPYAVSFLTPQLDTAGQVVVTWEVVELPEPYIGQGFNVYRRRTTAGFPLEGAHGLVGRPLAAVPPEYEQLNGAPLGVTDRHVDDQVRGAETYAYLLEDLRQAGETPRLYGPRTIHVAGGVRAPQLVRVKPNPFTPADGAATLQLVVPPGASGGIEVALGVYNVLGRLVRVLVDGPLPAGKFEVDWDGRTLAGNAAPSGAYYLRLESSGRVVTRRLTLVR